MARIRVYNIEFLYLTDMDYQRNYNIENNLDEYEVEQKVKELEGQRELILPLYVNIIDESKVPEDATYMDDDFLEVLIEDEVGEYFTNFEWEYLVD